MFLEGLLITKIRKNVISELKKETNTSRFLGTFRKFGEEFKSVYESEPQAKVFSRITSTNKLSLISSSGYVSKQQSFFYHKHSWILIGGAAK